MREFKLFLLTWNKHIHTSKTNRCVAVMDIVYVYYTAKPELFLRKIVKLNRIGQGEIRKLRGNKLSLQPMCLR